MKQVSQCSVCGETKECVACTYGMNEAQGKATLLLKSDGVPPLYAVEEHICRDCAKQKAAAPFGAWITLVVGMLLYAGAWYAFLVNLDRYNVSDETAIAFAVAIAVGLIVQLFSAVYLLAPQKRGKGTLVLCTLLLCIPFGGLLLLLWKRALDWPIRAGKALAPVAQERLWAIAKAAQAGLATPSAGFAAKAQPSAAAAVVRNATAATVAATGAADGIGALDSSASTGAAAEPDAAAAVTGTDAVAAETTAATDTAAATAQPAAVPSPEVAAAQAREKTRRDWYEEAVKADEENKAHRRRVWSAIFGPLLTVFILLRGCDAYANGNAMAVFGLIELTPEAFAAVIAAFFLYDLYSIIQLLRGK